jgi:hypothetical protein
MVLGCGGGSATGPGAADGTDAGGVVPEAGSASEDAAASDAGLVPDGGAAGVYPAAHPAIPQVVSGGTVMTKPKVVNVSFAGDPLEADIDAFAASMGKTTYWGDRVKEYGIAPPIVSARIHDTYAPPATIDDAQIQTWLTSRLDGTHAEYPAPDANTIYTMYFPPGVSITNMAAGLPASCGTAANPTWHGYHGQTALPNGTLVVYAVISRCASIPEDPSATGIQYVSAVTSHEVIEGITDPFVESNNYGYAETDNDHIAFSFIGLAELGDMCALVGNAFYTPPDLPYLVQRIWSNKVAPTGHDPCLPELAGHVYFNTAPVLNDTVTVTSQGQSGTTKGALVPVGQTKMVELDLFSEAPTPGPWSVTVHEIGGTSLDLKLDETSGQNGDKLNLSIHVLSKNPAYGAELFVIESKLGTDRSIWVGFVGN